MKKLISIVIAIIIVMISYRIFLTISIMTMINFAQEEATNFINQIFPQEITSINQKLRPDHKAQETKQLNQKSPPDHNQSRNNQKYPKLNVRRKKLGEICNKVKCIEMYEYTYTTCSRLNCKSSIKKVKKIRFLNQENDNKLSTI